MLMCVYISCHPSTGECICKTGWDGSICNRQCPLLKYGKGCLKDCQCKNNALCSPINGNYIIKIFRC